MLGVRGARELTRGTGSESWRRHEALLVDEMSLLYHMGKNGVKAGKTPIELFMNNRG
jgi:hypothetical protein